MSKIEKPDSALTAEELSVFCFQLSLMLKAGIGVEEGVGLLSGECDIPQRRALLDAVRAKLLDGCPLSAALEKSGVFPAYLIRMLEIGQAAGRQDQVLTALSDYYRREAETTSAVRRAILYPAVMAVLVAAVFLILMVRVLPVFEQVFKQLGIALSPVARGLLSAGAAGKYIGGVLVLTLGILAIALLFFSRRRARGAQSMETRFLGRGKAALAVDRSRFSSAMSLMLSSGLPLDEAMDRTVRLLESSGLSPRLAECRSRMEQGASFPRAVADCGILNGMQSGLLAAGFRSGVPEQAMEELALRCADEADTALSALLSRLEFALVILLCAAVGLVLLSVMLPLLGVLSAIG